MTTKARLIEMIPNIRKVRMTMITNRMEDIEPCSRIMELILNHKLV